MKINASLVIAALAVIIIAGWFWTNSEKNRQPERTAIQTVSSEPELPTVVTRAVTAETHTAKIKLFGRTEPAREVTIKAETPGPVISTPVAEGSRVSKGTIICRQDVNARQANLDQAMAMLKTRELEYQAATKLVERGFASETQALTAQAGLDAAKAGVKSAEIELGNINLRAPFSGIFDKKLAEVGDYLAPGQPCGLLIELDPLIVAIDLTESQLSAVKPGLDAQIILATGETVSGKVKFVESRANAATRTFRAEIAVPNKKLALKAGVTATVSLNESDQIAHLIPGKILSLNDAGVIGVKYLDIDNRIRFAVTTTIDETEDGLWVKGLPVQTRIIVKGQNYVSPGIQAVGVDEADQ